MAKYRKAAAYVGKNLTLNLGRSDLKVEDGKIYDNPRLARFVGMGFLEVVQEEGAVPAATPPKPARVRPRQAPRARQAKPARQRPRQAPRAKAPVSPAPVAPVQEKPKAPKKKAAPKTSAKPKVFSNSELNQLKKADLVKVAKSFGLELDQKMLKGNMVAAILKAQR